MSNCLKPFNYSGHSFVFDSCANAITMVVDKNEVNFNRQSLNELSKSCFKAYEFRLKEISEKMYKVGMNEYEIINKNIISTILPYSPLKFSFSITQDPSLHFFVRFEKSITLFVETFLDIEDGHDTYFQIFKSDNYLIKENCSFDYAITLIQDSLEETFKDKQLIYFP